MSSTAPRQSALPGDLVTLRVGESVWNSPAAFYSEGSSPTNVVLARGQPGATYLVVAVWYTYTTPIAMIVGNGMQGWCRTIALAIRATHSECEKR